MKKNVQLRTVIITICLTIFAVCMIFPIYVLIVSTLRVPGEVFDKTLIPATITFDNYIDAMNGELLNSIKNSFIVASTVTIVALIFHAMAGYALARLNFRLKKFFFAWMMSTLMVPFAVIIVPLFMVVRELGMTNSYAGLIIPSIFNAYGIFLFRQFYINFPKELEEAAYIEGCSHAVTFFRIVLPLSKPVIIPLTIAFFIANWNSYLWPLIVNQKAKLNVIQVTLANMVGTGYATPWGLILTSTFIAAIPTFIIFFLLQKELVEGIKMQGFK